MDLSAATIDNILKSLKREDRVELVRKRFEESEEWEEHKRWHEEHGGEANLQVWEVEVPAEHLPVPSQPHFEEARHKRTVKVGGCDCQPRSFMELTDKGEVHAGIPQPLDSARPYTGLLAGETEEMYANGEGQRVYHVQAGDPGNLYR